MTRRAVREVRDGTTAPRSNDATTPYLDTFVLERRHHQSASVAVPVADIKEAGAAHSFRRSYTCCLLSQSRSDADSLSDAEAADVLHHPPEKLH